MADEQTAPESTEIAMATIVVETYLDADGQVAHRTSVTEGVTVLEALGMLRYAEHQIIAQPHTDD